MSMQVINNLGQQKLDKITRNIILKNLKFFDYEKKEFKKILLIQPPDGDKNIFDNKRAKEKKI
tara:strand:- start:308 stop:496 length:189 start_codon:yes stop_codon:yes gene_type:complete